MSSLRQHRARAAVPAATALAAVAAVLAAPAATAWADQEEKGAGGPDRGSAQGSAQQRPGDDDPAGNNGTVKVDGVPLGDGRGNEPHVDCAFALDFYGFDAGQTADITFTGKAPTGSGTLLAQKAVAVSDDAAGGGQDRDATVSYTAEQLGLTGTAPHRNGWHVKVAVDVLEAPGGAKQKVFWLDCDAARTGTTGTTPTTTGTTPTTTTGTGATPTTTTGTGATPITGTGTGPTTSTGTPTGTTPATTGDTAPTGVAGVFEEAPTSTGTVTSNAAAPAAVLDAAPGALPTTGGELAALVLLGLTAIGVGTAGVLAGRSSRETALT